MEVINNTTGNNAKVFQYKAISVDTEVKHEENLVKQKAENPVDSVTLSPESIRLSLYASKPTDGEEPP